MFLFKNKNKLVYSNKDLVSFEEYVHNNIGKPDCVFQEIVSDDLIIDIMIVAPTKDKDYYTLITKGMGAYKMNVPAPYRKLNRAELAMRLPKDWDVYSKDDKWYWPIKVLKTLARLPYKEKSWFGIFHDIDFAKKISDTVDFSAVVLDLLDDTPKPLKLKNGDQLVIYNVIPIFDDEIKYLFENDGQLLVDKLIASKNTGPVDINRKSVV